MNVTVFGPGTTGGMHHYPVQLANGLTNYLNVSLVIPEGGDATEHISNNVDVMEYKIPDYDGTIKKAEAAIRMYRDIYSCVKATNPTIIHDSFIGPTVSSVCLPLFRLASVPVVSTLHDPIKVVGENIGRNEQRRYILKNKLGIAVSDITLVHGESTWKQAHQAGYNLDRMDIVPHGKYDLFRMYDYKQFETETNTLLFFGSIRPEKGFDRVTQILDHVEQEIPDITAIVAGNPLESQKSVVKQLRQDERIELHTEYIPNSRVGEFFSRATAVVLPYYRATSSGVLMTAYAFEKPVVATRVGDIKNLVSNDEVGLLADDVVGLSNSIRRLLTNQNLYNNKKQNIVVESKKYSWGVVGQKTTEVYKSLLELDR